MDKQIQTTLDYQLYLLLIKIKHYHKIINSKVNNLSILIDFNPNEDDLFNSRREIFKSYVDVVKDQLNLHFCRDQLLNREMSLNDCKILIKLNDAIIKNNYEIIEINNSIIQVHQKLIHHLSGKFGFLI